MMSDHDVELEIFDNAFMVQIEQLLKQLSPLRQSAVTRSHIKLPKIDLSQFNLLMHIIARWKNLVVDE
ncbi:hypothetical protein M0802_000907 [Mischocyttarus mexicanus]|nr:hypothetical protein M0802_000907 [Mischocyttarus mexicanus]